MSEPLTEERLEDIEWSFHEYWHETPAWEMGLELIAEVRRLQAQLAEWDADIKQNAKATVEFDRVQNARITVLTADRDEALARVAELERRADKAEAEVERLRTQLDDLRIIHTAYPGTALDEGDLNVFIKATMDEKWTQHAAPCSIPWLTIGDWLCELRDYRKALGE